MINNGKQKQWEENFHTLSPSPTHLPAPGPIYSTSCLCGWTAHGLTYGQPFPMFTRSLSLCCPWLSPFSCIITYPLSTGQFRSAYIDTYVISPILQIKQITLLIPNSPSTIIPFFSSHPQQSYLWQLSQIVLLFSLKPTSIRLSLHRSTKLLSSGSPIIGELLNPMVLSHFLPCLISLPHSTPVISPISLKLSVGHNTL